MTCPLVDQKKTGSALVLLRFDEFRTADRRPSKKKSRKQKSLWQQGYVDVSENRGTPKSSHFNRVFHYKPSILG